MKVTVFTSNNARHVSLIESLASVADEVFACMECVTLFPGQVEDFYKKTPIMANYFSRVIDAEKEVFGNPRFLPANVRTLPMRLEDLNKLSLQDLAPALESDFYVVFGASYIKGSLIDFLVQKRAVNIHMGVSPYFRGASCNFWAIHENRIDLVGGTIHYLTKGLDSGPMLFHALPKAEKVDPFVLGMKAVRSAHQGLVQHLRSGTLYDLEPLPQNRAQEIKYTKHLEFNDEIASRYLQNVPTTDHVFDSLNDRDTSLFWNPIIA